MEGNINLNSNVAVSTSTQPTEKQEKRREGVSKSIIIGVGGTGLNIIHDIRKRLLEKYKALESVPIIEFIAIDSDSETLGKILSDIDDAVKLPENSKIFTQVTGVQRIAEHLDQYPHLKQWVHPAALQGDITTGCGAIRARGKIAFAWNYPKISEAITNAYKKISLRTSLETATRKNNLQVAEGVSVYIVGSLLGGTGSGMFLDVAYTVRELIGNEPILDIIGIFVIPPSLASGGQDRRASGYAALIELNHYTSVNTVFNCQYQENLPAIKSSVEPFKYCYLVDLSNPKEKLTGKYEAETMIGHYIFLDLTSEFQSQKKSNRNNIEQYLITPDFNGCPQNYLSFGLSALYFPRDLVKSACAHRLAGEITRYWMKPGVKIGNINQFTNEIMTRLNLHRVDIERDILEKAIEGKRSVKGLGVADQITTVLFKNAYEAAKNKQDPKMIFEKSIDEFLKGFNDTDPNQDVLMKLDDLTGSHLRNLKSKTKEVLNDRKIALTNKLFEIVNEPKHRHPAAQSFLTKYKEILNEILHGTPDERIKALSEEKEPLQKRFESLKKELETKLQEINKTIRTPNIPGVKDKALEYNIKGYTDKAKELLECEIKINLLPYIIRFYEELYKFVSNDLQSALTNYINIVRKLRRDFLTREKEIIETPRLIKGKEIFENGEIQDFTEKAWDNEDGEEFVYQQYKNGDIDKYYNEVVIDENSRNQVIKDIMDDLGISNISSIKSINEDKMKRIFLKHCSRVFSLIDKINIIDLFFERVPQLRWKTEIQAIIASSQPYILFDPGITGFYADPEKTQTVIGIACGKNPRTENEQKFLDILAEVVPSYNSDHLAANSLEPFQVLFIREEGGFPLRRVKGLTDYRNAYELHLRSQAANNPLHTMRGVDWQTIDKPGVVDQQKAFKSFVLGWASGVIEEKRGRKGDNQGFLFNYKKGARETTVTLPSLKNLSDLEINIRQTKREEEQKGQPNRLLPPSELDDVIEYMVNNTEYIDSLNKKISSHRGKLETSEFVALLMSVNKQLKEENRTFYDNFNFVLSEYIDKDDVLAENVEEYNDMPASARSNLSDSAWRKLKSEEEGLSVISSHRTPPPPPPPSSLSSLTTSENWIPVEPPMTSPYNDKQEYRLFALKDSIGNILQQEWKLVPKGTSSSVAPPPPPPPPAQSMRPSQSTQNPDMSSEDGPPPAPRTR